MFKLYVTSAYMSPDVKFVDVMVSRSSTPPKPIGPFYNLILNICDALLEDFSSSRIPQYMKALSKSLKRLGKGFLLKLMIKRFSKKLLMLSAYTGRLIKPKIKQFLNIITEGKPFRNDLFVTLNNIFNVNQDNKMDDYIYELKKYGYKRREHIYLKTRRLFKDLIFRTIEKQDENVKGDIQLKFKLAVIEYMEDNQYTSKT